LAKQAGEQLNQRMRAELKANESLPEASIRTEIIGERYNHSVADTASELTGFLEIVATGLAYDNDEFNKLVFALWSQDVPKSFHALGTPSLTIPAVTSAEGQHMTMRVKASGRVQRDVDTDALTNAARWQTSEDATTALSGLGDFTRPAQVKVSPGWASRALRVQVTTAVDPATVPQAAGASAN
jgi:hypothetical protein